MSLNVSAIFPPSPIHDPGSRTEKSPSRMLCRLVSTTARSNSPASPITCECPLPLVSAATAGVPLSTEIFALRPAVFIYALPCDIRKIEKWGFLEARLAEPSCAASNDSSCRSDSSFYIPRKTCAASTAFLVFSAYLTKKAHRHGCRPSASTNRWDNPHCPAKYRSLLPLLLFGRGNFASVRIKVSPAAHGSLDRINQVDRRARFQHQPMPAGPPHAFRQSRRFMHGENDYL